jgi:hypothetical protein
MRLWLSAVGLIAAIAVGSGIVLALGHSQARSSGTPPAAGRPGPSRAPRRPATPAVATPAAAAYSFSTLDDARDAAFSQLLGINNKGHIAGYAGSGVAGHPSRGFILRPPYGPSRYQNIDVPGSAQTQLTGLNDAGVQVGFWSAPGTAGRAGRNTGFYLMGGHFTSVGFPTGDNASPPVNHLLGVNNHDVAVGFYADAQGRDHGYQYDIATGRFSRVLVSGASSVTAAAINNFGAVAGYFTGPADATEGFFLRHTGQLYVLRVPGATATEALGVNDSGEVVGAYQVGSGRGAVTHGFTWTRQGGFATVDDPDGPGATTISGVNNAGDLVGFYINRAGDTEGLMATPDR